MADYQPKPNTGNCFLKEGFQGYSGQIKLETGEEFWVTVYDNDGKKGPYRTVKLKPKQAKQRIDPQAPDLGDDSDAPW